MDEKLIPLSRTISYALRHNPDEFGLILDEAGWVLIEELLAAIKEKQSNWDWIDKQTLEIIQQQSDKQRFEILEGSIRAMYGHSLPKQRIQLTPTCPPDVLYHGTAKKVLNLIKSNGLQPMQRQYVHLSADTETAVIVGKRRDKKPVILEIDSKSAHENGTRFYHGNQSIWLADPIEAIYIRFKD